VVNLLKGNEMDSIQFLLLLIFIAFVVIAAFYDGK